jgi:hypothetical protein
MEAHKAIRRDTEPMGTVKTDPLPFAEVCMDTVDRIKTEQHQAYIVTTPCRSTLYVTSSVVPDIQARTLGETLSPVLSNSSFSTTLPCHNLSSHKTQVPQYYLLSKRKNWVFQIPKIQARVKFKPSTVTQVIGKGRNLRKMQSRIQARVKLKPSTVPQVLGKLTYRCTDD